MRTLLTTLVLAGCVIRLAAQPTGGAGANLNWRRGGNTAGSFANIIGPTWASTGLNPSQMWFTTAGTANYRMAIFDGATDGRIAMSNNLPVNFAPVDRLHLHGNSATGANGLRFSSTATGAGALNGFGMGINNANGLVYFTQFQAQPMLFFTSPVAGSPQECMRMDASGQIGMNLFSANNINGSNGTIEPLAQLDLTGPMFFSDNSLTTPGGRHTLIATETTVSGSVVSLRDGFRMEFARNFLFPNVDYIVFNKTDGNQAPVDGGFAFTRTGNDDVENLSFAINGNGRGYFGQTQANVNFAINRFTIESAVGDATPSGLCFVNLNSNSGMVNNPGPGLLSVDAGGNVIYVPCCNNTGSFVGNYCGLLPNNALTTSYGVPLNNFNYNFFGQGTVNIGDVLCNTSGVARLFVRNTFGGPNPAIALRAEQSPTLTGVNYAAYFLGDLNVNGFSFTSTGNWSGSDRRFKKDIQDFDNALGLISKLQPKTYHLTNEYYTQLNTEGTTKQYGLIAQDVEKIMPELVHEFVVPENYDSLGNITATAKEIKSVNYTQLIAVLIKGMQEQQAQIEAQNQKIDELIRNTGNGSPATGMINVDLSDKNAVVLTQNVPNPFAEQTTIGYNIPETAVAAQILFFNAGGQLIKAVDIETKGKGQLNVFASDLSTGTYSYSLVVDGKIMDTKKMIKSK